jgi:hypothetical protein
MCELLVFNCVRAIQALYEHSIHYIYASREITGSLQEAYNSNNTAVYIRDFVMSFSFCNNIWVSHGDFNSTCFENNKNDNVRTLSCNSPLLF